MIIKTNLIYTKVLWTYCVTLRDTCILEEEKRVDMGWEERDFFGGEDL